MTIEDQEANAIAALIADGIGLSQAASERIEAVEQEVENLEGRLAHQIIDLGQARRSLAITVEQVQAAIPNDAVLVEYVRYAHYLGKSKGESRYAAVLLSAGTSPHWFTLGSAKEIESALRRYQVLVRTSSAENELEVLSAESCTIGSGS